MKEPFLYDAVDFLYHSVADNMPPAIQDKPMASAFVLGASGIYGVVKGIQLISRKVMSKNFNEDYIPLIEKVCITGMIGIPLLYSMIDPEGAREIMTQHPVYTSGMLGVEFGSITAALQDLHKGHKRRLEERL